VKRLVDTALSRRVASGLTEAGHDAIQTGDRDSLKAPDEAIVEIALAEERTIISLDTDFGTILALQGASKPSFELLRPAPDRPEEQLAVLVANLPPLEAALEAGAVAVIEPGRIRLRSLPIEGDEGS